MSAWRGLELGRVVVVFSGVMYAGMWVQLSLFHRAGAFKHPVMYAPVILTPLIIAGAALGAVTRIGAWGWISLGLLAAGALGGMVGVVYHVRGITSQIGGLSIRNLLSGPPPVLPMAYSLVGVLGLLGLVWNA